MLFSLLTVTQLLIDIAGELGARAGRRFSDYTRAVRNLALHPAFPSELVDRLARLPGFRNVLLHAYVALDYEIVIDALGDLEPLERFLAIVVTIEADGEEDREG